MRHTFNLAIVSPPRVVPTTGGVFLCSVLANILFESAYFPQRLTHVTAGRELLALFLQLFGRGTLELRFRPIDPIRGAKHESWIKILLSD